MYSAEPLPHFVDEYLAYLHEVHPTNATFDGVHLHDDLLEDLSRPAIDAQIRDLGGFARRLAAIDPARLTEVERLERPALDSSIRARLFEIEQVRTWERNPQYYSEIIATSLASQALFDYAPLSERARRVASKLRQVPRLIQAARDNIKDAPGIFVKVGLESMRGHAALHRRGSAARLLAARRPAHPRRSRRHVDRGQHRDRRVRRIPREGSRAAQQGEFPSRTREIRGEAAARRGDHARRRSSAGDRDARARRSPGGVPASRVEAERRTIPARRGRKPRGTIPPAGQLVSVAQEQLGELVDFINRQRIVTIPNGAPVDVAPTPKFYRWTFASMWTPGPFEARPLRATYYLTDVDPAWGAERQTEHLRDFSYGALWSISIHEVFPGHFLHYQHLRQVRVEAAQVDHVLVDRDGGRLGALLRADDARRGIQARRSRASGSGSSPKP